MSLYRLLTLISSFFAFAVGRALPTNASANNTQCRCFPGDACWPSASEWDSFNQTVQGRLIATVPIASVCHNSTFGQYDAAACQALKSQWLDPATHYESSSSPMAPFFTNNTCNPYLPPSAPCNLGNYVSFAVNATGPEDFQKTIGFAKKHNIRLVIRNTGHDYLGKSTGAGALAIWTHYMKDKEIVDYESPSYHGKAAKFGAGVQVRESYDFSHQHGFINVGGDCPTVGVVGGYTQGAGHGPIASKYGMAADQALEWEVVTAEGKFLVANREQNEDLYWALSGGGGGTYGVVSSLTVKVYPDLKSSAANLTFPMEGTDKKVFWKLIGTWVENLPNILERGCFAVWSADAEEGFGTTPVNCPGLTKKQTKQLFNPVLSKLHEHNVTYKFNVDEFPDFLSSYETFVAEHNAGSGVIGSRLPLRDSVFSNLTKIVDVWSRFVDIGGGIAGTCNNASQVAVPPEINSMDPVRRQALYNMMLTAPYNNTNYDRNVDWVHEITNTWMPQIEALTPGGRAYMNEANWQQPDWQHLFYGENYEKLLSIKDKYDPQQLFYAHTAVGSDRWFQDHEKGGRLCRAP